MTVAKLTAEQRKNMSARVFGLPAQRAYPLNDESHARLALAMVAKNGTPAEQAQVKAAVYKKFPQLKPKGSM